MGEMLTNPWVIGIGSTIMASVIAGLILYYGFGIGKAKPRKPVSNHQEHSIPVSSHPLEEKPVSSLLPEEIFEYLNSLPPLQREAAAKNYEGIRVSWKVNLENAYPLPNGKLHLMMLSNGEYPWVYCNVDSGHYPELNIMKTDRLFFIEGEIESAYQGGITLTNCQLHF